MGTLRSQIFRLGLSLIIAIAWPLSGQDTGSISGAVHDTATATVAGATVIVLSSEDSVERARTLSDAEGRFELAGLKRQSYIVMVNARGFADAKRDVAMTTANATVAFVLEPASAAPKFQAAGVRGLIDPGGYSVPASAASASGLVTGMADIQQRNNTPSKDWPCRSEPGLKAAAADGSAQALRNLGEFYLAHRRFQEAYPVLKMSADKHPDAKTLSLLAESYEGAGLFSDAAKAYHAAAQLDASDENLFGEGYELVLAGSAGEAEASFRTALKQRPGSFRLWIGNGATAFFNGRPDAAAEAFLRAIDLKPDEPAGYDYLFKAVNGGAVATPQSEPAFERFAKTAPQSYRAQYYYALSLRRQNRSDNNIEALLRRSIALNSDWADSHFELANFLSSKGNTVEAIDEYQRAVMLDPGRTQAHYRLAQAYRSQGDREKAGSELKAFEAAKSRKPDPAQAIDLKPFVSLLGDAVKPATTVSCLEENH